LLLCIPGLGLGFKEGRGGIRLRDLGALVVNPAGGHHR